jgi:hypothetical protein
MAFYSSGGTDLDKYFPTYEYSTPVAEIGASVSGSITVNLTRNLDNTTNYMVFYTFYNETTDYNNLTKAYSRCIVYNKTSSSFNFFIYNNTNTSFIGTGTRVMFWIVYVTDINSQINLEINTGYTDNGVDFSRYFPEYYFCVDDVATPIANYTVSQSTDVKRWGTTDYHLFSSYESGITNPSDTDLLNMVGSCDTVLYGTTVLGKTSTLFNYYLRITNTTYASNMKINTIALLPAQNQAYSSNYTVKINSTTRKLNKYYPECEFFYFPIDNTSSTNNMTCVLTAGKGTTNYIVIVGGSYNDNGSGGNSYSPYNASHADAFPPVITSKTTTSFTAVFTKSTGDIWDGGFQFIVIYY